MPIQIFLRMDLDDDLAHSSEKSVISSFNSAPSGYGIQKAIAVATQVVLFIVEYLVISLLSGHLHLDKPSQTNRRCRGYLARYLAFLYRYGGAHEKPLVQNGAECDCKGSD